MATVSMVYDWELHVLSPDCGEECMRRVVGKMVTVCEEEGVKLSLVADSQLARVQDELSRASN